MVRVYNVSRFSPNTNDTRMVYELFADTKSEVVPGVKVEGLEGTIPVGTKLHTAAGEVARMTSGGNWVWSSNSGSNGEFVVNLYGDKTTTGYPVADCTYDDILAAMDEGLNIVANVIIDYTDVSLHPGGGKISIFRLPLSCREIYEPGPNESKEASDVLIFNRIDYSSNTIGALMLISGLVWQDTQKLVGMMVPARDRRLPVSTEDDHGKILAVALDGQYFLKEES